MKYFKYLLILIPISILFKLLNFDAVWVFFASALAIVPLAGILGIATEEISIFTGPKIGGFLNATFGNATELIIAIFALKDGLVDVVKASVVGSIIGNILLVLGASMFFGGLRFKSQKFNRNAVELSSSMLLFAVAGLCIPAVFTHAVKSTQLIQARYEYLNIGIACLFILIYILSLFFSFYTHKDLFGTEHEDAVEARWSIKKSIIVLFSTTLFIALESELLVGSVEPMTEHIGISKFFVGIILIPIIGNAAEHSTAIVTALKNKMNIAVEIAIGSSLQVILFVIPVLILLSLLFTPMSIVFNEFELISLVAAVLIANKVAGDGESNWLEGLQLIAVYVIIALSFLVL